MHSRKLYWLIIPLVLMAALLISCAPAAPAPVVQQPAPQPTTSPPANATALEESTLKPFGEVQLPITPVSKLHTTATPPEVNIDEYRLIIDGLVENPLSLTYDELLQYPTVTAVVLLECPGFFTDNAEWTGIPISTLLAEAGVKPEATKVRFHAMDGYRATLSLELAMKDGVFLAHTVNGQVLPIEHGYPVRLVVTGEYGDQWVKWVNHLEVKK